MINDCLHLIIELWTPKDKRKIRGIYSLLYFEFGIVYLSLLSRTHTWLLFFLQNTRKLVPFNVLQGHWNRRGRYHDKQLSSIRKQVSYNIILYLPDVQFKMAAIEESNLSVFQKIIRVLEILWRICFLIAKRNGTIH